MVGSGGTRMRLQVRRLKGQDQKGTLVLTDENGEILPGQHSLTISCQPMAMGKLLVEFHIGADPRCAIQVHTEKESA